jgi:hypothetical protein
MTIAPPPPDTLRPALAAGTEFVFTRKGVYFRNNVGSAMLEGEAAKELIRALAPFLDGTHSIADLLAAVSKPKRAALQRIVTWLLDRRIAIDAGSTGDGMPSDVSEYLASLGVPGVGATTVRLAADAELAPLAAAAAGDLGLQAEIVPASDAVAAAVLRPPGAWIASGCSECFVRRLADAPPPEQTDSLTKHYAAALLARTALHRLAGIETPDVVIYDATTRTTAAHALHCHHEGADWQLSFALRLSAAIPATAETLPRLETAQERYAELDAVVDEALGPIVRLHEDDFTQLPLSRSEAVLAYGRRFAAAGFDYYESRLRAATMALEAYAAVPTGEAWALRIPSLQPVRILAPVPTTIASGWTYEELLARAILGAALPAVTALDPLHLDAPRVRRLLRIAARLGVTIELRAARAPLGIPAVVANETASVGMSLSDAAEEALLASLAPQCGRRVAAVNHPPSVTTRQLLDNVAAAGASGILIPYASIPCRSRSLLVAGFSWT